MYHRKTFVVVVILLLVAYLAACQGETGKFLS